MKTLLQALVAGSALMGAALFPVVLHAEAPGAVGPQMAQLLFVQSASGLALSADGKRLTLKGLSPTTLFFSDRPIRIAGHYRNEEYLRFWKDGPDSFLKDPPNATLSVFEKGKDEMSDVVVTLRNPQLSGNEISYDVTVISGKLPQSGGPASLFIDIIGLPFTPLSFAGVARRTAYRTAIYGGAAAAAYAHPYAAAYYHPYPVAYPAYVPPAPVPVAPPPVTAAGSPPPIGAVVSALPPGCVSSPKDGVQYYDCSGVYYRTAVQGGNVVYVVQPQP